MKTILLLCLLASAALMAQTLSVDTNGNITVTSGQLTRPALQQNRVLVPARQVVAGGMLRELAFIETQTNHNFAVTFTNGVNKTFTSAAATNRSVVLVCITIDPDTQARTTNTLVIP